MNAYARATAAVKKGESELVAMLFEPFFAYACDLPLMHQTSNLRVRQVEEFCEECAVDDKAILFDVNPFRVVRGRGAIAERSKICHTLG